MVFMPPRHGKSELVTIRYPIYRMERNPRLKVILAAHTQDLADEFSGHARRIARERLTLSREQAALSDWKTAAGGGLTAVGVRTAVTGRGGGLIVIDDPVKGHEEAANAKERAKLHQWYRTDLFTRGEPKAPMLLIQTRWHEEDLAGTILRSPEGPRWEVLRLPALAETQEERDDWARKHGRPTGEPEPLGREPGAALWPEQYSREDLLGAVLTPAEFASLYQQTPFPTGGTLFQRAWFDAAEGMPEGVRCLRFWDCAGKA